MFGCLLSQIRFRDPDFLTVELVEGTSVITGPKCNKGPSVITFEPSVITVWTIWTKCNKGFICLRWSALVNIRGKALLPSVGFRKRMTSHSPSGSPCDSCKLRFDRPLWFVWWSDVCFGVLSCFFDHPSIESTKKMSLHLFGKDGLMFRLDQAS